MSTRTWRTLFDEMRNEWTPEEHAETARIEPGIKANFTALALMVELKESRRSLGLTQQELAQRVGMSQSEISRLEKLAVIPQMNTLILIANALGYTLKLEALPAAA